MKKFTVVAIDETGDWAHPDLVKRAGGKIFTLYAYDPNERVNTCEGIAPNAMPVLTSARGEVTGAGADTPSYWLAPFDCVPNVLPSDEHEWESLYDELQFGFIDGCDAMYFGCKDIDGLDDKFKHTEEFDSDYTLDDATEEFRGNSTMPEVCR